MDNAANTVNLMALMRLSPISELLPAQIEELAAHTPVETVPAGTVIFSAGDTDRRLEYVLEGTVELCPGQGECRLITGASSESRHPLAQDQPRHATAMAKTAVKLIRIDQELLDTMLSWAQSASSDTEEVIMSGNEILTIDTGALKAKMQKSINFRKLPAANIDQLLEKMEPMRVHAGEIIIRQGDVGDYFYVIEQGEALVTRIIEEPESSEDSIEMAHLGEGASFGEAALISDKPRNATVSMQTDGVLLRLNKQDFLHLMQEPMQHWVDASEAQARIAAGARWIDVRQRTEYEHDHLPGAINVPLQETHRRTQELDHGVPYICYCQTGRRSSAAAFILTQYGFDVCVLRGGLNELQTAPASASNRA